MTNRRHSPSRDTCKIIGIETSHENMKQIKYKPIYSFKDWSNFILQHILIVFIFSVDLTVKKYFSIFFDHEYAQTLLLITIGIFLLDIYVQTCQILLCHLLILNVYQAIFTMRSLPKIFRFYVCTNRGHSWNMLTLFTWK